MFRVPLREVLRVPFRHIALAAFYVWLHNENAEDSYPWQDLSNDANDFKMLWMSFVAEEAQAALPAPHSQALVMWMELQWRSVDYRGTLLCQRSVAHNAPKKPAPELHSLQKQKNEVYNNAISLREFTPPSIQTPPHSHRRTAMAASLFHQTLYGFASGYQPQSPSDLLIIKYCFLFLYLRKSQKPTNSPGTTVRVRKIDTGISCTAFSF